MSQKGLAPILIVLILAFLVGGYLVYQQSISKPIPSPQPTTQPSPTSNSCQHAIGYQHYAADPKSKEWTTYTNEYCAFEIQYPKNWWLTAGLPDFGTKDYFNTTYLQVYLAPHYIGEDSLMSIRISSKSVEEEASKIKIIPPGSPSKTVSEKDIEFNSYPAREIIKENTMAKVKSRILIISHDGKTYVIGGGIDNQELMKTIDQILSTFKFLP